MLPYAPYPILFSIGNINFYSYGLMIATAFLISYYLTKRDAKNKKLETAHIDALFLYGTILGLIGARLLYTIETSSYSTFFKIWDGGLSSFGGILFIFIFIYIYAKKNKIDTWRYLDCIAPYAALAIAIGRIGCLLRGCCHGIETNLPWAIQIGGQLVHPTQLYEIIYSLLIFIILLALRYKKSFNGQLTLLFLIFYSIFRFLNEFVRAHEQTFFSLSLPQYFCILTFIIATYLYIKKRPK